MRADWKNENWSKYLYDNIPASMLKAKLSDGDLYYKGYNELSDAHKREFFVMLFSSLARFESGFDPKETYEEGFNDSKGKPVISRGLFQVSVESLGGYKFKTTASELHDPLINIRAMLTVANRWLVKDECIAGGKTDEWLGLARYWSVFRKAHRIAAIRKNTNALSFTKENISMDYFGAPWMAFDNDLLGRVETDAEMNKRFVPGWKLSGLPGYKTLVGNRHAWCIMRTNLHLEKAGIKGTKSAGAYSLSLWGRKCPFWFGAQLDIKHKSGGRHANEFLYWIDEAKKIAATRDGNRSNKFDIFQTDLSGRGDTLVSGPRWPLKHPDGQLVSMKEVLAKYPFFKVNGSGSSTR